MPSSLLLTIFAKEEGGRETEREKGERWRREREEEEKEEEVPSLNTSNSRSAQENPYLSVKIEAPDDKEGPPALNNLHATREQREKTF